MDYTQTGSTSNTGYHTSYPFTTSLVNHPTAISNPATATSTSRAAESLPSSDAKSQPIKRKIKPVDRGRAACSECRRHKVGRISFGDSIRRD
jgi:hypothetical protein